ncbi:hypothetical protein NUM3379_08150 [Kineococcus sp. NUM-3379]
MAARQARPRGAPPTGNGVPDQILAAALLGTLVVQLAVAYTQGPAGWSPHLVVAELAGALWRAFFGSWFALTAGRPRRRWTWAAVLVVDCLLLTLSMAAIPGPAPTILILLLARLPFACSALPVRQLPVAGAAAVGAPALVVLHRALTQDPLEWGTLWVFLVAAALVGGSTVRVTRALAAAEARARELAAQAGELAERRQHDAMHDALTGLANRSLYADRLAAAVAHAERTGTDVAVLLIDLDRFKLVNDSRGHHAGDELLLGIGQRLCDSLRSSDTLARLGGDEFAAIVQDVGSPADALTAAAHLRDALRTPFRLRTAGGEQAVYVTASIGIAFARGRAGDLGAVLREADTAMYRAKARGRGLVEVFDESTGHLAQRRLDLETRLRQDLDGPPGELSVAYQPIVDPVSGRALGLEALARWTCAGYGPVAPDEFIAIAEDSGLIHELGREVLRTALADAVRWHRLHPDLEVAVNVSPVQLHRAGFAEEVAGLLAQVPVPAHRLCLEVTEGALLERHGASSANLRALDELGVVLAVDDFGSGYSSLAQLRRFPVGKLKADRSFVDDPPILGAVADLGAALGCPVLAEGVETPRQREVVVERGYTQAQGFLWARPQPAGAISDLLRAQRAAAG